MSEKIKMVVPDTNEEVEFFIIEQTRINNTNYILVTEEDDAQLDEVEAYILKDLSSDSDEEAVYEFVEDDDEMEAVSSIFAELLDDIDIES